MEVRLENVGKKFNYEWLFKKISFTFSPGTSYAITGPNGSGKSTLIQLIAGNQLPSDGKITYHGKNGEVAPEDAYRHLAITAPYLELIEEFTLDEALRFHFRFKNIRDHYSLDDLITIGYFQEARTKYIRNFSSGMKQRLKLLLALYSDVSLLLLDEPATNLDEQGIAWYKEQIEQVNEAAVLVASNQLHEYSFCDQEFSLRTLKS